uniref:Uncharacterized protein n=1 Tax=Rhizophora mucronata TaxID=61149 RepID=A0A2P2QWC2_RHIMU
MVSSQSSINPLMNKTRKANLSEPHFISKFARQRNGTQIPK